MKHLLFGTLITLFVFGLFIGCDSVNHRTYMPLTSVSDLNEEVTIYGVFYRRNSNNDLVIRSNSYKFDIIMMKSSSDQNDPIENRQIMVTGFLKKADGYYIEDAVWDYYVE